jgi:hypothetical protein
MRQLSMCTEKYDLMACVRRSSPISPPHARVTSQDMAQQDKDAGEARHRLKLDVTSKGVHHRRHMKKSLVVVDKLKDRATHGGGDVAFVAGSRGSSRGGDSRAVNLVEVDRWQNSSQKAETPLVSIWAFLEAWSTRPLSLATCAASNLRQVESGRSPDVQDDVVDQ